MSGTSSNESKWIALSELKEPFNDALNYRTRLEKEFFNRIFLRTESLKRCLHPSTYFLMGDKGTGKTAYAVYLENNSEDKYRSLVTTMTETQYKRFMELKRQGKLSYSDYANIWRSMLLFIVARMLVTKSKGLLDSFTGKFRRIENEIERWGKNALNPEIETAFEAIRSNSLSGALKSEHVDASANLESRQTESGQKITHYLLETEGALKEAISSLSLENNHILFVDGIDYRPETVPYQEYLECVKGLGESIWQLNTEYFGSIRDSRGRIKIVLLVRPDVFHELNLYNSNSRLQDNTVFLDWSTTEREFNSSALFELSGKYFSTQQRFESTPASAWAHYYDDGREQADSFKRLLKLTFQKPRDILTFVKITRSLALKKGHGGKNQFPTEIHSDPAFTREFSDYLLGEVKNYAAFYMPQEDFYRYMKFFQYLDGKRRFVMTDFVSAYARFKNWAAGEEFKATAYLRDAEALLQLFYDMNVIGYSEQMEGEGRHETFYHWSTRERTLNNIAPKVKASGMLILNSGIAKAIDIGKGVSTQSAPRKSEQGAERRRRRKRRF